MTRSIAIVGRPNVGKSRLFNRLAGRRLSIVHDQPGITRDVVATELPGGIVLLDTGGIGLKDAMTPRQLIAASAAQVDFAISAAEVILFMIDGRDGVTPADESVAAMLRRSGKRVVPVVNKIDSEKVETDSGDWFRLGFGEPVFVSAEHGRGEAELRDRLLRELPPAPAAEDAPDRLKIAFVGKPNVGKSSLANRLLSGDRLIVSEVPGTTRDAVELDADFTTKKGGTWRFRLIDTAGLRRGTKIGSPVEYFSQVRSRDAIHAADVVYLVLDALEGVARQDQAIAGMILEAAKPMVVLVNKWDLVHEALKRGTLKGYENESDFRKAFLAALERRLFFTPGSPVIFVSALAGMDIERMLRATRSLDRRLGMRLPTGKLNQTLIRLAEKTPPTMIQGRRFRIYYAVQTGNRPLRIKVFCNQVRRLEDNYRRYLEKGLVEAFGLDGCPIRFDLVGKERRVGPSVKATQEAASRGADAPGNNIE